MDFWKSIKGGDPLGRQGVESLRGASPPPPKSAPEQYDVFFNGLTMIAVGEGGGGEFCLFKNTPFGLGMGSGRGVKILLVLEIYPSNESWNGFNLIVFEHADSGADLGFSRGGGGGGWIFKKNSKILSTFFLGRPNWFLSSP